MAPKAEDTIKILNAKKATLFQRIQRIFDLSKNIEDPKVLQQFKVSYRLVDKTLNDYDDIEFRINALQMELDPEFVPTFADAIRDLVEYIEDAAERSGLKGNGQSTLTTSSDASNIAGSSIRLPKIELPSFNGDQRQWINFYEVFKNLVHENKTLSDQQRVQYLISKLSGSALNICKHLSPTATNYSIIWDALIDRYNDPRAQADDYLDQIFDFKALRSESREGLGMVLDKFCAPITALKRLNVNDLADTIFLNRGLKILDPESRRAFESAFREKDIPTYTDFVSFIEKQIKTLPFDRSSSSNKYAFSNKGNTTKPHALVTYSKPRYAHPNGNKTSTCMICRKGVHALIDCVEFLKLSPWDRYRLLKHKAVCLKCFSINHSVSNCDKEVKCMQCNKPHHTLLHFEFKTSSPVNSNAEADNQATSSVLCSVANNDSHSKAEVSSTVLLSTARVNVINEEGKSYDARLLIDSGSQCHFLTTKFCRKIKLRMNPVKSSIMGFGGTLNPIRGKTFCCISSKINPEVSFSFEPFVVDKIIDKLPASFIDCSHLRHLQNLKLADERFHIPGEIDGIIGAELVPHLLKGEHCQIQPNQLVAVDSVLGHILMGKAPILASSTNNVSSCMMACHPTGDSLIRKFWEIEDIPDTSVRRSSDEIDCENLYQSTVRRLQSGRFVVSLPFRDNPDRLGDSFEMAKRRLLLLEKRLERDREFRKLYHQVMIDYLQQGHMSLAKKNLDCKGYYIPHHGIFKQKSSSTPMRVVFDASAKTDNNLSLNEILFAGPKLQNDIFVLLINFRLFSVALSADIKQMYRQIIVDESHRKYQRIAWRFSSKDPIETYELNCVVFGISSSPYLALRTVHKLVEEEGKNFPTIKDRLPKDMYMDDFITSVPSLDEAAVLYQQSKGLFESGGFQLTKWASNAPEILDFLPSDENVSLTRGLEHDGTFYILGLEWQPNPGDVFRFQIHEITKDVTKRTILSAIARMFDPLGFFSPVTLFLKIILKQMWQQRLEWDDPCPPCIKAQWEIFQKELSHLSGIFIPRHIGISIPSKVTLIGFCDASELGYGAVVYVKSEEDERDAQVSLLCAKSKVAPIKFQTIPRLELCAALLLTKLMCTVLSVIRERCEVHCSYAFSDSMVVLHWINTPSSKWQTFVANRVEKIQEGKIDHWLHVAGSENPADCLSRGLTPCELIANSSWWTGPFWLKLEQNNWPISWDPEPLECQPELKNHQAVLTTLEPRDIEINSIYTLIKRCSNYTRLLRILVYVLRFLKLLPKRTIISFSDLNAAELNVCRVVQTAHFYSDINKLQGGQFCSNRLQRLTPFLDQGIMRVGGRLRNSDEDFDSCHPIVLPKRDTFVDLLIDYYHQSNCHAGPHLLLSILRQKFWILSARHVIRGRIRACNSCFRMRPSVAPPKMGNLPACRVSQCKPFLQSGVDYAGPISITMARRRKPVVLKAYICLFVCLSTKAIHIELVSELSTAMFLAAFRRFISRRGPCNVIFSDCGTNFVGARAQLKELSQFLNSADYQDALNDNFAYHRVEWKFIPPGAPHFGGIWEANIKSVKSHLFRVIGKQLLTYEELNTVLIQIEAVLNSRPLCPLSSDPGEPLALTPSHFLTLTPLKWIPAADVVDIPLPRLSRYQLVDHLIQSFWVRWRREYLHELQVRNKWSKTSPSLSVGTVVIMDQPNLPPLQWPLGVVEQIYPGTDGVVRVALVRTTTGRYKRPVVKLYPLPSQ